MATKISTEDTGDLSISIAEAVAGKLNLGGAMQNWIADIIQEQLKEWIDEKERS